MGDDRNLWQQMLRDCSVRSRLPVANLLVAGDAESGKSALLARLGAADSTAGPSDADDGVNAAMLAFSTINVLDPKARAVEGGGDASEDTIAKIAAWSLNERKLKELVRIAVKPQDLAHTVVVITLDLSRPWTIKNSLEQWTSVLEGELLHQMNELPIDARNELYASVKQHILGYEDPSIDRSGPAPMDVSTTEFLEAGVLSRNLGVPLLLVVAKADLRPENSVKMDFVEYTLRQFAVKYGAAVIYTSAKTRTNVDVLRDYILHRAFPTQFAFKQPPQLVDRSTIFVPSGYDTLQLVDQTFLGSQPQWTSETQFSKLVPAPAEQTEDSLSQPATSGEIRVDTHQVWLEKLERAAGAGLEELQKQSIEASKRSEAVAATRREAVERRKREEKDVSTKHLQNFFNNLLSRPEKSKSSRSVTGDPKKTTQSDVKSLAEQELQNLSKRTGA